MSRCECNISEVNNNELYFFDMKIDKERLYDNFVGKTSSNIEVIKCYYLLFNVNYLVSNIGSYVILFLIFAYIVCTIIFCVKGYQFLLNQINYLFQGKKLKKRNKRRKSKKWKNKKIVLNHMVTNSQEIKHSISKNAPIKKSRIKKPNYGIIKNSKDKTINSSNTNKAFVKEINEVNIENLNKDESKNDKEENISTNSLSTVDIMKMNDFEINSLSYQQALQYDKRTYSQYYWSILKIGHIILFIIFPNNDYNSMTLKICLFLFSFGLYYTINALFFTNSTMHQIYLDEGKFNFIYQIPHIIYSTCISSIINILMKYLSLTEKYILSFKAKNNKKDSGENLQEMKKCLIIKFILFFLISYIFLIFFWFYTSCFCAVYRNTQIYLIWDTIISFSLGLLYPIGYYLIPGIFRIIALKNKNKECLYKFSLFIQLI